MNAKHHKTIILGAGISGLSCGFYCKSHKEFQSDDVIILEASSRAGGRIQTLEQDGLRVENGPNALLMRTNLLKDLISSLKLEERLLYPGKGSQNRFVCREGELIKVTPLSLMTRLTDLHAKFKLTTFGFSRSSRNPNETIFDFFSRKFSPAFAANLIVPLISGIYAGDTKKLIMKNSLPLFYNWDKKYNTFLPGAISFKREKHTIKSGMCSFPLGLNELINRLVERLKEQIHFNQKVSSITRTDGVWHIKTESDHFSADNLVTTLPASEMGDIIHGEQFKGLKRALNGIYAPPMTLCHLMYKKSDLPLKERGFGFLNTHFSERRTLGCLFSTHMFSERVPTGYDLFTVFVGGTLYPKKAHLNDEAITRLAHDELVEVLKIRASKPEKAILCRWDESIAQTDKKHLTFKKWCDANKPAKYNLFFSTNYWNGISIPDCIATANHVASQVILNYNHSGKS